MSVLFYTFSNGIIEIKFYVFDYLAMRIRSLANFFLFNGFNYFTTFLLT